MRVVVCCRGLQMLDDYVCVVMCGHPQLFRSAYSFDHTVL